jgi:hypothetical protein
VVRDDRGSSIQLLPWCVRLPSDAVKVLNSAITRPPAGLYVVRLFALCVTSSEVSLQRPTWPRWPNSANVDYAPTGDVREFTYVDSKRKAARQVYTRGHCYFICKSPLSAARRLRAALSQMRPQKVVGKRGINFARRSLCRTAGRCHEICMEQLTSVRARVAALLLLRSLSLVSTSVLSLLYLLLVSQGLSAD